MNLKTYLTNKKEVINCFVIDHEKGAANQISNILGEFDNISYLGMASKQDDALNTIIKHKPNIIFLNIDMSMGHLSEFMFDVYQYSEKAPVFIALSNCKDYAFEAYRYDFFDYLLKPLTELSLRKCFMRYQKKHPMDTFNKICLQSYRDYHYLNTDEILFLKADNNSTDFQMLDGSVISAFKTLKTFENILPQNFLRIHKSYIINSNCISRINYGKSHCVIKNDNYKIPFTKTFKDNIDAINSIMKQNTFITLN